MAQEIVIVLIVGLAGWYLVRRYLKNRKAGVSCSCSDGSCSSRKTCAAYLKQDILSDGCPERKNDEKETCSENSDTKGGYGSKPGHSAGSKQ